RLTYRQACRAWQVGSLAHRSRHDVDSELALSHCKPREGGISFVTAGVLVVVASEADDPRPPHLGSCSVTRRISATSSISFLPLWGSPYATGYAVLSAAGACD